MWEVSLLNPATRNKELVGYTAEALLSELVMKVSLTPSSFDQEEVVREFIKGLRSEVVLNTTPAALVDTAFRFGYFYRVFLERNDVVCPTGPASDEASDQQS